MLTDIGEFIVGAHLQLIEECDFIDYNVRPPCGGLKGLGELDVVGLNFNSNTPYLCEVTTRCPIQKQSRNSKSNKKEA